MNLLKINYKKVIVGLLAMAIVSCSSPWDDREDTDANLGVTLDQAISSTAGTGAFTKLLAKTGYDKILASSKTYTVFVPTDAAMAQVDPAILADEALLKEFVGNHIALTAFSSVRDAEETQVKMMSTKYLYFKGKTIIDDATIVTADRYASNGVYHIINKALTPKLNVWQYINSKAGSSAMADYLLTLKEFSIYRSDAAYKALLPAGQYSDSLSNSYLKNVYNLNNEKNRYTMFLMEDEGFNTEVTKLRPYLVKKSKDAAVDSTGIYTKYFTTRDLVVGKKIERANLPATITSRFGVEVPIDKAQIVGEPIQLSNGIVYIMKRVDVPLEKRLVTKKIEGENYNSFANGVRANIMFRDLKAPNGVLFNDILVQPPKDVSQFSAFYSDKDFFSTTYKVIWRAVNTQTNVFQQCVKLGGTKVVTGTVTTIGNPVVSIPYTNVGLLNYNEVEVGTFTLTEARDFDLISVIAANTGVLGNQSLVLDYLKFVPQVKK